MLSAESLSLNLKDKPILQELDFTFERGKLYVILGPNGAGKSSFLRVLGKLLDSYNGKVVYGNKDLREIRLSEYAKLRAYLPQRDESIPQLTVKELILFGRMPHLNFEPSKRDYQKVEELLQSLNLKAYENRPLRDLSGGELQRALLARALAQEPVILLLDEPVNHLDPKNQLEILRLVKKQTIEKNIITIMVLHEINLALSFGDYFIFMKEGRILAHGNKEIITSELLSKVYELPARVYHLNGKVLIQFKEHP
ncbi:MAG: ABC transporter ATP-binding protein [Caldimicrobium sp.]|nr:ABC transporter ATP-binding protein [Caldimicrobium sp.]MCX7874206.1 ABC transporter ATP-binding protein [Caldimicrobium sp.]MDW8094610.1 ABC transporter ATP-binding protein [Caldimicrobium sp.]